LEKVTLQKRVRTLKVPLGIVLATIADTHCLPNESELSAASVWQTGGPVNDDIFEAWSG
jgi:hypothetical protein